MLNAKLAPVLVMMGVTAAMWGCGDDDKPSTGTGGRNTAGTSGKGGSGGKAGSAGRGGGGAGGSTGGSAGSSAGKGGAGAGAGGTTGGTAGKGGTAGTGGTVVGGQGGEGGDALGGAGGAGGEGGGGPLSLQDACDAICADQMPLACDAGCLGTCVGMAAVTDAPTEYEALVQCEATKLGPSDYTCHDQSAPGAPDQAGPAFDGPCDTELCAWTCAESLFYEENTYADCGC